MFDLLGAFFSEQGSKTRIGEEWKPVAGLKSYHPFSDQIVASDKGKAVESVNLLKKYQT